MSEAQKNLPAPSSTCSDERLKEFTSGKPISVPLSQVDAQLSALWRMVAGRDHAADSGAGAAGKNRHAITRACLWNLLVRVPDDKRLDRARSIVDATSSSVPARVLVLDARPSAKTAPIRASIEVNWHTMDGGSTEIGSDEVTLSASGDAVDDLAPVVRALTVPDVPTAALWLATIPNPDAALDRELLHGADRLVFDSDGAIEIGAGNLVARLGAARALVAAMGTLPLTPVATDLAWLRASVVRSLLASLFDPPACAVSDAGGAQSFSDALSVEHVAISCRADRLGTAALLAAWLASRLHLDGGTAAATDKAVTFTFRRQGGGSVAMKILVEENAAEPIGVVEMHCPSGRYALSIESRAAILESPSLAWKEPLSPVDESELWTLALSSAGRDRLYPVALALLALLR